MDKLTRKTFETSRNLTYTYYHHSPSNSDYPTLLLQHGFPDDHNIWSKVLPYLLELPYPILAPDLLGYNGTSKPTDAAAYNSKGMASDLAEILDHEGIKDVVSVGHDWGSRMATRMWLWYPERVTGVLLLNVAYSVPAEFKFDEAQETMEKMTGLPRLSYWDVFTAKDGAKLLRDRIESFYCALHGEMEGKNTMEELFCHRGAMRKFLEEDRRLPLKTYAQDPALKEEWISRMKRDGFEGPVQWYVSQKEDVHWPLEKELSKDRFAITVPMLFIGATQDTVCLSDFIYGPQKEGLLPDLTIKSVESGHWQTLEVPEKTGPLMVAWLKERESDLKKTYL